MENNGELQSPIAKTEDNQAKLQKFVAVKSMFKSFIFAFVILARAVMMSEECRS